MSFIFLYFMIIYIDIIKGLVRVKAGFVLKDRSIRRSGNPKLEL